ncbi:MAG TPA: cob(I)yrinic acid a,c-diamide adenosyltransferase [Bacteroidales bacterium]|nr:cob(I)yrinic acid a,c-diamide adenosyltransferase [Bacteroidales bacterium]
MEEWKIYTRKGDKGETSLLGGQRVPKYHERIEAYGTVDELNSFVAVIRDMCHDEWVCSLLLEVEERLFTVESVLAAGSPEDILRLPKINDEDITILEDAIDKMNEDLPPLTSFILPGGNLLNSYAHIAERCAVKAAYDHPQYAMGVKYLNRLSDYLFVLARKFSHDAGDAEIAWKPRI